MLITWFDSMVKKNPEYAKYFEFCFPQHDLRLFDRPHNYGEYVWVDRVHLNCQSYMKLGDCLADKVIGLCEKNSMDSDRFVSSDWDVIVQNTWRMDKSRYWKIQHFKHNDYLEYVRKCPIKKEKSNTVRWLNFAIKNSLNKGEKYKISILLKYGEDTTFTAFLHGERKIDYLPIKNIRAEEWTTISYEYVPSHSNIRWFSLSATNFISAGQKLCIKKIYITKEEEQ